MIKAAQIDRARQKIAELVATQLRTGSQSQVFDPAEKIYACGQFLNKVDRDQRGLHGTAASMKVLASYNPQQYTELLAGLVKYVSSREAIEGAILDQQKRVSVERIKKDENNVIKLAEVLIALSHVPSGIAATEDQKRLISEKLLSGLLRTNGWYFLVTADPSEYKILPSAFACYALHKNGNNIELQLTELKKNLEETIVDDPVTFSCLVFALYVAVNLESNLSGPKQSLYRKRLRALWRSPHCRLESDFEQNMEYWHGTEHDYIRIPWQIYLLAIASKLSPWYFSTRLAQRRLASIVNSSEGSGFKYPHSGNYISSRTNSIAFEALGIINTNLKFRFWYLILNALDNVRIFFGSNWIKIPLSIIAFLVIALSVFSWQVKYKNGQVDLGDIAGEFMGAFVIFVLLLAKKR